jgi:hypothetical protein
MQTQTPASTTTLHARPHLLQRYPQQVAQVGQQADAALAAGAL